MGSGEWRFLMSNAGLALQILGDWEGCSGYEGALSWRVRLGMWVVTV